MTKKQILLVFGGLFAAAIAAMFLTMSPAPEGVNASPTSLKWLVYVAGMALVIGVLLPFIPILIISLLVLLLLRKQGARELSFKIAAVVTLAWIVLSTYGQLSAQTLR